MPTAEKYANQAYVTVVESAANTLTFEKLETGISIFEKKGWLIHRIEYFVIMTDTIFATKGDYLEFGLTASDQITALGLGVNAVIDYNRLIRHDLGTAGTGFYQHQPFVKDLSNIHGGGFLVPPNPIYVATQGNSLGAASTVAVRFYYSVVDLKADEFWELVEIRRMIGT